VGGSAAAAATAIQHQPSFDAELEAELDAALDDHQEPPAAAPAAHGGNAVAAADGAAQPGAVTGIRCAALRRSRLVS
jgi:hypothetical protein